MDNPWLIIGASIAATVGYVFLVFVLLRASYIDVDDFTKDAGNRMLYENYKADPHSEPLRAKLQAALNEYFLQETKANNRRRMIRAVLTLGISLLDDPAGISEYERNKCIYQSLIRPTRDTILTRYNESLRVLSESTYDIASIENTIHVGLELVEHDNKHIEIYKLIYNFDSTIMTKDIVSNDIIQATAIPNQSVLDSLQESKLITKKEHTEFVKRIKNMQV